MAVHWNDPLRPLTSDERRYLERVSRVKMERGAKGCLSVSATTPAAPLLVGVGPSSFEHEVEPGFAERHYLLAYHGGTAHIPYKPFPGHAAGPEAIRIHAFPRARAMGQKGRRCIGRR